MEQQYGYPPFGALPSVRNVKGNSYRYFYDAAGRLDSLDYPGGGERYLYDGDGRLVERWDRNGGNLLQHDIITHTQQGQIATVSQSDVSPEIGQLSIGGPRGPRRSP